MIEASCHGGKIGCCSTLVVVIEALTSNDELVKITSCAGHAAAWIWDLKRVYPGHRGIRTRRVDERDRAGANGP